MAGCLFPALPSSAAAAGCSSAPACSSSAACPSSSAAAASFCAGFLVGFLAAGFALPPGCASASCLSGLAAALAAGCLRCLLLPACAAASSSSSSWSPSCSQRSSARFRDSFSPSSYLTVWRDLRRSKVCRWRQAATKERAREGSRAAQGGKRRWQGVSIQRRQAAFQMAAQARACMYELQLLQFCPESVTNCRTTCRPVCYSHMLHAQGWCPGLLSPIL